MTHSGPITCRKCQALVPAGDRFCPTCGKKITDLDRSIGAALGPEAALSAGRPEAIRKAVRWMIILGVLFIIFGTIFGMKSASEANAAKAALSLYEDDMIFRGVIQAAFEEVGNPREALLIQAGMFAFLHLSPVIFLSHFGFGLVLGYLRQRSRSLFPGMLVHAAWNAWVILNDVAITGPAGSTLFR